MVPKDSASQKSTERYSCQFFHFSWKIYTNSPMSSKASPTTIAVSTMNMEKMLLPEAPLHLCTPMALARCVSEATETST